VVMMADIYITFGTGFVEIISGSTQLHVQWKREL